MSPPVLLHGFAGTPAMWDGVIEGRALALPVRDSWDATIDAIAVAPDDLVIGYSLGARLALGLLARDRIAAAVLISVNPGIDDAARAERRADDARWARLLRERGIAGFLDAWEAQPLFARVPPALRARRRAARLALDPEQLARSLETTGLAEMPDLRDALTARAHRAHLVTGGADAKFTAIARAAVARAPALGLDVLPDVGHDPTLEAPERLAPVLAAACERLRHVR